MSHTELLQDFWTSRAKDIQLGMIGKIDRYDKKLMRADVAPLLKSKNALGEESALPTLSDIPVLYYHGNGFYIRPVYKRGDYVWIGFSTHDIDNALNGYTRAASEKIFSIENACVLHGLAKKVFTPPVEFASADALIIGHEDGNSFIEFAKDKVTFKFSGGAQTVEISAAGIKFNDTNVNLKTHVHSTSAPGAPTGTPTPGS